MVFKIRNNRNLKPYNFYQHEIDEVKAQVDAFMKMNDEDKVIFMLKVDDTDKGMILKDALEHAMRKEPWTHPREQVYGDERLFRPVWTITRY